MKKNMLHSRMPILLIVLALGFVLVQGCKRTTKPTTAVQVVADMEHYDFGMMEQDTVGTHDFLVRNAGSRKILLQAGKASCSLCTRFDIEGEAERLLEPGEEARVNVEWSTKGKLGSFSVDLPLLVPTQSDPVLTLSVTGNVSPMLSIMPSKSWDLGDFHGGEPLQGKGAIVSHLLDKFEITSIETSSEWLKVTANPLSAEDRSKAHEAKSGYELTATIDPDVHPGEFHSTVRLKTDVDGVEAEFDVSCVRVATVRMFGPPGFNLASLILDARRLKSGEVKNLELQLFLQDPGDGKESTFAVDSDDKAVTLTVEPDLKFKGKSRRFVLKIEIDTNMAKGSGLGRATILIKTNDEEVGTIKLRIKYDVI